MQNKFYKKRTKIENWLNKHKIDNYVLIEDEKYGFVVNVMNDVTLIQSKLKWIPIKFNKVGGYFNCSQNELISLEFCPKEINGSFICSDNKLTSLEFCPEKIQGNFNCSYNKLTSLEFCPKETRGYFAINHNQLKDLVFFPQKVIDAVYLHDNEKLGDFQKEQDFKRLYVEHLECKRKVEFEKINSVMDKNISIVKKNKI